ncbi:MAG: invasion associated locus B family protein [Xanthobacteraceae bacterium]
MKNRSVGLAPKGTRRRAVTTCVAAALTLAIASDAGAQQATPPAAKPQPKKPAAAPAAPTGGMPQGVAPAPTQEFVFSPWTKFCGKDGPEGSNAKSVCGVLSEARVETGQIAAAVVLIEPEEGSPRLLRVTLPLGVRLPQGTRIMFDDGTPAQGTYLMCLVSGCISDFEANADVLAKMRKGQNLTVQALNPGGYAISISFPLQDFAKADDGPATDTKTVAEQSQKLQEGLKSRAEEVRKQRDAAPPATPGTK